MKLRTKLFTMFTATTLVSILLISGFSIAYEDKDTTEYVNNAMQTTVSDYAMNFDTWFEKNAKVVETTNNIIGQTTDGTNINPSYLQSFKDDANSADISTIYVALSNGKFCDGNGWVPDNSFSAADKDWYNGALTSGKTYISSPFDDEKTGKSIVAISTPLKNKNGTTIGVTSEDVFVSSLNNDISKMKYNGYGYAFLIDQNGNIISHADKSKVGSKISDDKQLDPTIKKVLASKSGSAEYKYNGSDVLLVYKTLATTGWTLCLNVNRADAFQKMNTIFNSYLLVAIIILALVLAISIVFATKVTKPIKAMTGALRKAANGDLSTKIESRKKKRKDEIGQLEESFNDLMATTLEKAEYAKRISQGDLDFTITEKSDKDVLAISMKQVSETLKSLTDNIISISDNAVAGNIEVRGNSEEFSGVYKKLVDGMNSTLDAVEEPINDVRKAVDALSVNDFTVTVSDNYNGVFKSLADDVNKAIYQLIRIQSVMVQISDGNIELLDKITEMGKFSENDQMIPAIISVMQNIKNLIDEVNNLSVEAVNGNFLNTRGNTDKFSGGYREIISGFNNTLDAISEPLIHVMNVLKKLSANDLKERCSNKLSGDFKKLATSVNSVQGRMLFLENLAVKISEGDISGLEKLSKVGKLSENDELLPAFIKMMQNIKMLIDETEAIANSAALGKLDIRGDAGKFNGRYAEIILAINSFLDAVAKPTNEITALMEKLSKAEYGDTIDGEFNGQFETLVNAVNETSTSLAEVIENITNVASSMAAGDFSNDKVEAQKGDLSALSNSFNTILDSLNEVLGTVNDTAAQVAAGSQQVSEGSRLLSDGATEQASSVEELTSTIEDIAGETKKNAVNADKANTLVLNVKTSAKNGSDQMAEMLKSMKKLSESSQNISKIIKVIDDIAFQTNILALNAAVEAARAGQAGKGFSVVADEVRNLASKSANAVKETSILIDETVERVESGAKIADNTAKSFEKIVSGIGEVSNIVSDIAAASNQQSNGILQINTGIEQVSKVVQTNSATSEESAAASEELATQAILLKNQVSKFVLRSNN